MAQVQALLSYELSVPGGGPNVALWSSPKSQITRFQITHRCPGVAANMTMQ